MSFSQINNSKILVTGASGFIGSHLVQKLLSLGAKVYGVSRKKQADDAIKWFVGDLSDINFVEYLFEQIQPDYIFHLASHVLGARDEKFVLSTFNSNLVTTINLLHMVTKYASKRLILAGSFEEGNPKNTVMVPSSPYAASKIAATNYANMYYALYDTPVCTASLYMVYGPGQIDRTKLIPYTILKTLNGETPELTSGLRMIDWIFVHDVVDGLLHMLIARNINGKTIDIGTGKSVSIKEIVDLTVQLIDKTLQPAYGLTKDRPMEQEKNANVQETFRNIKWKASTSLENGLKKTIDFYSQNRS